jgi:hypothetical protein
MQTHLMSDNLKKKLAVNELLWENMVQSDGPRMTISHGVYTHSMLDT